MYSVLNVSEYNSFIASFKKFKANRAFRYHNENIVL